MLRCAPLALVVLLGVALGVQGEAEIYSVDGSVILAPDTGGNVTVLGRLTQNGEAVATEAMCGTMISELVTRMETLEGSCAAATLIALDNCPLSQTLFTDGSHCLAEWTLPTAASGEAVSEWVSSATSSVTLFPAGVTPVFLVALGDGGTRRGLCLFNISCTIDSTPPQFPSGCPRNQTLWTTVSAVATWEDPVVMDDTSVSLSVSHTNNTAFPVGTTRVTYLATDSIGRSAECTFSITVKTPLTSFITTWSTPAGGIIALPLRSDGNYNFSVNYGDGSGTVSVSAYNDPNASHMYSMTGFYVVEVTGIIDGWSFQSNEYASLIVSVDAWGPLQLGNSGGYFEGCTNLKITATDQPILVGTTTLTAAFKESGVDAQGNFNAWDVSQVTHMDYMFHLATAFNQPLDQWNTGNVVTMQGMFYQAASFSSALGSWDTSKVSDFSFMFYEASTFNYPLDFDTRSATSMAAMFQEAFLFNQALAHFNTGMVSTMAFMFFDTFEFNQEINAWDTHSCGTMESMFSSSNFNRDLHQWNTSNVFSMKNMFSDSKFNASIGAWDTSRVTTMESMFQNAADFNQPIGAWDVSSVRDFKGMFLSATSFNQPLAWNTAQATTMTTMFGGATSFNQHLLSFNTQTVNRMNSMFSGALSFNGSITNWNVENVHDFSSMFRFCTVFNSDLSLWTPSKGTNFAYMFSTTNAFASNISAWDVSRATSMIAMFREATSFNVDLSGWCVPLISSAPANFDLSASSWTAQRPVWGSCLEL